MPVSLVRVAELPVLETGLRGRHLDKSKFRLFKPLSLDVIFHGCDIGTAIQGNIHAFA
jgi:hypothetical protein